MFNIKTRLIWPIATVLAMVSVLGPSGTSLAAPTSPDTRSTSHGLLVRFVSGTSPQQMRTAIDLAGGDVVTDLSPLRVLATIGTAPDFATRIAASPLVESTFADTLKRVSPAPTDERRNSRPHTPRDTPEQEAQGQHQNFQPDPLHDKFQWDDARMRVAAGWEQTTGSDDISVAVLDTGFESANVEIHSNYDAVHSASFVPCSDGGQSLDCTLEDTYGHGTWIAGRIAGAANGFGSNGIAPGVRVRNYKVLSGALGGNGSDSWILAGMLRACDDRADVLNMSLGGYVDLADPQAVQSYLLYVDAVDYCLARGVAILSSASNDHVRVNRVNLRVGDRFLSGVGQVDAGTDGFAYDATTGQGGIDVRRQLEVPAGVPGVLMMSATNRSSQPATSDVPPALRGPSAAGQANQLTYYSNYGSRIDLAAPGGSTKFNISVYDGGPNNPLAGWGDFGPSASQGLLCNYPPFALLVGAFFDGGTCFIWIPGTSMATANASGVAALTLSNHRGLRGHPEQLLSRLQRSVRTDMVNHTTPLDPTNATPEYDGTLCPTGYCHLRASGAIRFSDAYGSGILDAALAVGERDR